MKGEPRDGTNRRHEPRPQRPGWVAVVEACGAWRRIGGRAGCNCFGHAPIWACFIAHGKPKLHIKWADAPRRSEEHTSELQSLMRISYAVFCLKKKQK